MSTRKAKRHADVVFRGRIVEFRDTGSGWRKVVFDVDRRWKGDVHRRFEIPAVIESSACIGFYKGQLQIGNELVVFAEKVRGTADYRTDICSGTSLARASRDLARLGPGRPPETRLTLACAALRRGDWLQSSGRFEV